MLQAAAQDDRLAAVVSEGAGARSMKEQLQDVPAERDLAVPPVLALQTGSAAVSRTPCHRPG